MSERGERGRGACEGLTYPPCGSRVRVISEREKGGGHESGMRGCAHLPTVQSTRSPPSLAAAGREVGVRERNTCTIHYTGANVGNHGRPGPPCSPPHEVEVRLAAHAAGVGDGQRAAAPEQGHERLLDAALLALHVHAVHQKLPAVLRQRRQARRVHRVRRELQRVAGGSTWPHRGAGVTHYKGMKERRTWVHLLVTT